VNPAAARAIRIASEEAVCVPRQEDTQDAFGLMGR
jgi:hypothetical protein